VDTRVMMFDIEIASPIERDYLEQLLTEAKKTADEEAAAPNSEQTSKREKTPKKINVDWTVRAKAPEQPLDGEEGEASEAGEAKEGSEEIQEENEAIDANLPVFAAKSSAKAPSVARVVIEMNKRIKSVVWHVKGDYFSTVSPQSSTTSVLIHRLSRAQSFAPFTKSKGLVQAVVFHPERPFFFVASQRHIRAYNLTKQSLIKKMLCPAKWISSLDIHPGGDHLLIGSYDRRVCWYDMDLSSTPYKTLKYHKKAVRSVCFHSSYPMFASCSDDGNLHIFHGMVYNDLLTNPLIVPVKILRVQEPRNDLGLLHAKFHPKQPWIVTGGSDHKMRLFI